MRAGLRRFWSDERGGAAAEFTLLTPVLFLFLFGMIDVGGYAWRMNMAQKATQYGARVAVVTNPIVNGLAAESYVGKVYDGVTLAQGDVIPASALGTIKCTSTACSCAQSPCPGGLSVDSAAFSNVLARMRGIEPLIDASNVTVEYRGAGLGYAGDPDGMEISPLATVRVSGLAYHPWMGLLLTSGIKLPEVSYTLPMEDASGSTSS